MDNDPAPTETLPGEPPQTCTGSIDSWSWSATISGPNGAMASMNPTSGPSPSSQLTVNNITQPGYYQVTVTATVRYKMTPCTDTVQRTGNCVVKFYVVGVDHLQFQLPGGSFQDMPAEGLYVATGTIVTFQAVMTPAGAPLPPGKPVWGGTCGASGTGTTTTTVTLNTPSASMSDTQTITAECGNTVSVSIVRYGPDQGTLNWEQDDQEVDLVVFNTTYKFWIPDADGDGRPDTSIGSAAIQSIDFDQLAQGTLPYPAPLTKEIAWSYENGVSESRTFPAFRLTLFDSPEGYVLGESDPGAPNSDPMSAAPRRSRPARTSSLSAMVRSGYRSEVDRLLQPAPGDTADLVARAINKGLGIDVPVEAARMLLDSLKRTKVLVTPEAAADRTKSVTITIDANTKFTPDLTVDASAFQVPFAKQFGINLLMEITASASTQLNDFQANEQKWYSTPFVAMADLSRDLGGITTDNFLPTKVGAAVNNIKKAAYQKGPTTAFRVPNPFVVRSGKVFNAMNYGSWDAGNNQVFWDQSIVTRSVDTYTGDSLRFAAENANTAQVLYSTWAPRTNLLGGPVVTLDFMKDDLTVRGYQPVGITTPQNVPAPFKGAYPNGYVQGVYSTPKAPYKADYLTLPLTVQWGRKATN
jgi:hypothetical protein